MKKFEIEFVINKTISGMTRGLTMGVFDGVHLGHQELLNFVCKNSRSRGVSPGVLLLHPSPDDVFKPELPTPKIYDLSTRIELLKTMGLDFIAVLSFNRQLAEMSALEFLDQIIVKTLDVNYFVFGHDLSFGKGRQGNFDYFGKKARADIGFDQILPAKIAGDSVICSTEIRRSVLSANFDRAKEMLGRDFHTAGSVVQGRKLGTSIGVPTLNLIPPETVLPPDGVYVGFTQLCEQSKRLSVINIGVRPTVDSTRKRMIEVHQIDHAPGPIANTGDLVTIVWDRKIRDEKKFSSLEELRLQIQQDITTAKKS